MFRSKVEFDLIGLQTVGVSVWVLQFLMAPSQHLIANIWPICKSDKPQHRLTMTEKKGEAIKKSTYQKPF